MTASQAQSGHLAAMRVAAQDTDARKWLFFGVALWWIVSYIRPQNIVTPLAALPLGYVALGVTLIGLAKARDGRGLRHRLCVLHIAMLVVIACGLFSAVNTFWLYQTFVSMATYWVVFYLALPLVLETPEWRRKMVRLLFAGFGVIGFWVITHGGRGQGAFLGDENDAALALIVGFGLCYPLREELTSRFGRLAGTSVLVLCVIGTIASSSRGGFLGLIAVLAAVTIFSGRFFKTLGLVALVVAVSLPFVPDSYLNEMNTISDPRESTRVQRLYMWRIGVQQYMSNPVFGVGAGNYPYRVADHENTEFVQKANIFNRSFAGRSVHSSYFQILPELGTTGAAVFLLMVCYVLKQGFTLGWAGAGVTPEASRFARGTAAATVGFLVAAAFLSAAYYPHFWLLCGLSMAVSLMNSSSHGTAQTVANSPRVPEARKFEFDRVSRLAAKIGSRH